MRAFIVSGVLLLALAACSLNGSASGSPLPSASASSGPSAEAVPSAPLAVSVSWERVLTVDENILNSLQLAREVVHGAGGFLAITESYLNGEGGPRRTQRQLWLSADGRAWEEVGFPFGIEGSLNSVTSTADGDYVLFFSMPTLNGDGSGMEAIRSADGRTWEPFDTGLPGNLAIRAIERGAQGWLLVGSRFGGDVEDPEAWYSSDGATWELVADLSEPNRWVRVSDAAAADEGFVIVGTDASLGGLPGHEWFALASPDGREWVESRGLFEPTQRSDQPDPHVAALGSGWVAALPLQDGSMRFWASDDGLDWIEAGGIQHTGSEFGFEPFLEGDGGRLYFSFVEGGEFAATPGAWSSSDAVTWEPIDLGADARLSDVAIGAGIVVLTGTELSDQGIVAGIWVGRSASGQ